MRRLALSLLLVIVAPAAFASDAEVAAVVVSAEPNLRPALPHELTLYPVAPQLNGKFSEHLGSALSYTYRVREGVGLQVFGQFNWAARESGFNRELSAKVRMQGQSASSNLRRWGITAGTELVPARGSLLMGGRQVHYDAFVAAGAGVATTRSFLRDDLERGAVYGDTGNRLLAQSALGVTAGLNERVALRVEYRRFFYSTRIDKVNGCTAYQLASRYDDHRSYQTRGGASTCHGDSFAPADVQYAWSLLNEPSSDVLHFRHLHAGLSVRF